MRVKLVKLTTKRLILRGPRPDDIDAMVAIYRDPRAMKYWSTPPHSGAPQTRAQLARKIAYFAENPTDFIIEKDGRMIGHAGLYRTTEVGFILHPDHWRQGIVTEAMQAIIPHLWAVTDHAQLTADVDPLNAASVALLKRLGFVETHRAARTFCLEGVWADSVYFALQRPS